MRTSLLGALATALAIAAPSARADAQTATWYIASYSREILVWDEASERVVQRIDMGEILPTDVEPNAAKTRLYVEEASGQRIEVVDLASRSIVDEIELSEGNVTVRINGFAPHPSDRRAAIVVKNYTRLSDRYVVEGPFLLEYDLVAKQVTDTIPWPNGEPRDRGVGMRYSPDGETLYMFVEDIIALDADTFAEVDRWAISRPLEPGLGRTNLPTNSGTYDDPGVATGLYRMTDPAQNRSMMGIARVRLAEKTVDFYTLGPSEPVGSFVLAPGGHRAYGLYAEVGRYEFWEFDLDARRVTRKQPFAGRPRMSLRVSADGRKLYVFVAGPTIDVYDATTFERLRTVEFDGDMAGSAVIAGSR
jgi:DNA-binding beta-propeller fold protein YncE